VLLWRAIQLVPKKLKIVLVRDRWFPEDFRTLFKRARSGWQELAAASG